jgi:uncharacterized membrane protein YedE/YeeE
VSRGLRWSALAVGAAFGFLLTASGLGDYDTIHSGLLLQDAYIYLMMGAAVGTAAAGIAVLRRVGRTAFGGPLDVPRRRPTRSTVAGSALFGVGFGVGATCPGITVAAVATGGLYGGLVLAGILAGLWLRGRVEQAPMTSAELRRPSVQRG